MGSILRLHRKIIVHATANMTRHCRCVAAWNLDDGSFRTNIPREVTYRILAPDTKHCHRTLTTKHYG